MARCPALWRASEAPFVVRISVELKGGSFIERILRRRSIVAERRSKRGRHLVLSDRKGRHRLFISDATETDTVPAISCDLDRDIVARLDAATALLKGFGPPAYLRPTSFQRHRLSTLLSILDTVEHLGPVNATSRRIASTAIYPGMEFGSALDWKNSSHRRQTQRLIAEAIAMTRRGYRKLLQGRSRHEY